MCHHCAPSGPSGLSTICIATHFGAFFLPLGPSPGRICSSKWGAIQILESLSRLLCCWLGLWGLAGVSNFRIPFFLVYLFCLWVLHLANLFTKMLGDSGIRTSSSSLGVVSTANPSMLHASSATGVCCLMSCATHAA